MISLLIEATVTFYSVQRDAAVCVVQELGALTQHPQNSPIMVLCKYMCLVV